MVADTLSRRTSSMGSLVTINIDERPLARDVQRLANNFVQLQLSEVLIGEAKKVVFDSDGVLRIGDKIAPPILKKERKERVSKDVHRLARLGVRLIDSAEGGIEVTSGAESSFVSEVEGEKDPDPILPELRAKCS
ncbi:hypothetical protein MTR67_007814 [Solanum verrucosum]|uniref:Uncharacterized protein n=1 Tax=Solanum verrucosum TaxID=315347 RepID=A0AAF0Q0A7_SOLVR|nr:hypothetical protein MTR67_007814 [Solanum verrucosum]